MMFAQPGVSTAYSYSDSLREIHKSEVEHSLEFAK